MKRLINFKQRTTGSYSLYILAVAAIMLVSSACSKQLDVKDPNDPTFAGNVNTEGGIAAYAQGSVYWNGFSYGDGWLGDSYFSLPWGYRELMGDVVGGGQGSNNQTTTMGVPDSFVADPANPSTTTFTNTSPQATGIIRGFNDPASTANGNNALYYEWTNMYAMINGCNIALENVGSIASLSADKVKTVQAWAYFWKGYAYAQLGSMYYAGLIEDKSATINNKYVDHNAIIAESDKQLKLAQTTLSAISNQGDYTAMISQLIPQQNQTGLGKAPSTAQFIKSINTLLARNILVNRLAPFVNGSTSATIAKASIPAASAADWAQIITYANAGIGQGDYVFTGRSSGTNSFFSATAGTVASIAAASNQNTTYKVSERLVANFGTGDARLANFSTADGIFYGDANTNTTRYSLVDGAAKGLTVPVLGSKLPGGIEVYIGPSYEENALMLAEAKIRTGDVAGGVTLINTVRAYQKAGVAALATTISATQALTELTKERGAALAFRGLSWFDARRWGWTYSIANGGGRYGATLIFNKVVYTNAKINYNFMDYWDVPGDETGKNAPAAGSAAVKNPNW
jgi:starch-binding outer membrane protein, SusD/RagB family